MVVAHIRNPQRHGTQVRLGCLVCLTNLDLLIIRHLVDYLDQVLEAVNTRRQQDCQVRVQEQTIFHLYLILDHLEILSYQR